MNRHFSVISKRGAVTAALFTLINIVLFSLSLAMRLGGGSRLWLLPIIVFAVLFLFSIMILVSVLSAGIDIKNGTVIMPDLDASRGKQPKFQIEELKDICLQDEDGNTLNPNQDSLIGARIVFLLEDGSEEIYYPVSITPKQFENIRSGMLEEASC